MIVAPPLSTVPLDQRITFPGSWDHFQWIQRGFEQTSKARLFYFDRIIEILMPGQAHAIFASLIGCLLMNYLAFKRIVFVPTRAVTQEKAGVVSVQADESYCLGQTKPIPDLAIEVVFTSGSPNKLARYQALGVTEVWFWEDGTLTLYHLRDSGYERVVKSELTGLEDLDIDLLKRCILIGETDAGEAIRAFMTAIA